MVFVSFPIELLFDGFCLSRLAYLPISAPIEWYLRFKPAFDLCVLGWCAGQ